MDGDIVICKDATSVPSHFLVILRICRGMEVILTVSKVNDDGALGDVVGGVVGGLICMHDGSLYPFFLLQITFGWRHDC